MPTRQTKVALGPDVLGSLRRALDLPADASDAQLVRAAVLRFLGQPGADGTPADRGGRRPNSAREHAPNP
jgi:hypothetical protein